MNFKRYYCINNRFFRNAMQMKRSVMYSDILDNRKLKNNNKIVEYSKMWLKTKSKQAIIFDGPDAYTTSTLLKNKFLPIENITIIEREKIIKNKINKKFKKVKIENGLLSTIIKKKPDLFKNPNIFYLDYMVINFHFIQINI